MTDSLQSSLRPGSDPFPETAAMSRGWVVIAWVLLAVFLLGSLFPLTFAVSMPAMGVVSLIWLFYKKDMARAFDAPLLLWLGAISALAFASILWAYNPDGAQHRVLSVTGLLLGSYPLILMVRRMPDEARATFQKFFPYIVLFAGTLFAFEFLYDYPLVRVLKNKPDEFIPLYLLNKNMAVFTVMLPFAVYLFLRQGKYLLLLLMAVAIVALMTKTQSQASQMAILVMAMMAPATYFFPRFASVAGFAGVLSIFVLMPFLAPIIFQSMADHTYKDKGFLHESSMSLRMETYDFLARKIAEKPLTGYGIDATRFMTFDSDEIYYKSNTIMHPHNMSLQVWIEFGYIGVFMFFGLLLFIGMRLFDTGRNCRVVTFCAFLSLMVFLMVSWSMWASWLVAFGMAVASVSAMTGRGMDGHAQAS